MQLLIQKRSSHAVLPVRATEGSAGCDLAACLESPVVIAPGEIVRIPTGISAAPDRSDCALLLFARSGLASRYGVSLANGVGVVDSDYRGELQVALINHGKEPFTVTHGMRIAQLVLTPVLLPQLIETDSLPDSERGSGGFGSTGLTQK